MCSADQSECIVREIGQSYVLPPPHLGPTKATPAFPPSRWNEGPVWLFFYRTSYLRRAPHPQPHPHPMQSQTLGSSLAGWSLELAAESLVSLWENVRRCHDTSAEDGNLTIRRMAEEKGRRGIYICM